MSSKNSVSGLLNVSGNFCTQRVYNHITANESCHLTRRCLDQLQWTSLHRCLWLDWKDRENCRWMSLVAATNYNIPKPLLCINSPLLERGGRPSSTWEISCPTETVFLISFLMSINLVYSLCSLIMIAKSSASLFTEKRLKKLIVVVDNFETTTGFRKLCVSACALKNTQ